MENPRSGGSPGTEDDAPEDHGVITLTDSLRDALSAADEPKLASVVQPWSRTEELKELGSEAATLEEHLEFLRALRALAVSARAVGHRLYCYFAL